MVGLPTVINACKSYFNTDGSKRGTDNASSFRLKVLVFWLLRMLMVFGAVDTIKSYRANLQFRVCSIFYSPFWKFCVILKTFCFV